MIKKILFMVPMASERLKEVREWGNFIITILVGIAIPVGIMVLKNEKLEIQADVREKFVAKSDFIEYRDAHKLYGETEKVRLQTEIDVTNSKFEKLEGKIEVVNQKADGLNLTLMQIQGQLQQINSQSPPTRR